MVAKTREARWLLLLAMAWVFLGAFGCGTSGPQTLASRLCTWRDHPGNPLIQPPNDESLIGDPTVVPPAEAPDGRWHLFANSLLGIHHYVSADGLAWERRPPALFGPGAFRPFVIRQGTTYFLFYEQFTDISLSRSEIRMASGTDLIAWGTPETVLRAELDWEKDPHATVGNPYVMAREGSFWLYYSANGVILPDVNFYEPRHIGLARADAIGGPYVKEAQALLSPSPGEPQRNLGAGSIKLLDEKVDGKWIALNNGIYEDLQGHTRSAIMVLASDDGLTWEKVCPSAPIAPTDAGWKSSFVYGFDAVRVGNDIRVYYNAREGWLDPGIERIGMSTLTLPR